MNEMDILKIIVGTLCAGGIGFVGWALQRHINTTGQNTVQLAVLSETVTQLKNQIKSLEEVFWKMHKMENDLNHLYKTIRDNQRDK